LKATAQILHQKFTMRLFNLSRKINFLDIAFWAIILTILSCNSTSITYSWRESITEPWPYRKILVVGIINNGDLNLREKMEMHLADDLSAKGYNAFSSLKIYGPKSFRQENEKTILQQIQQEGYDALLTIVLLNKEREKYYRPSRMYYTPYSIYYGNFWGYYSTIDERTYEPGYYTESTSYFWESNLYDVKTKKLVYAVQTKSFDPSSTEKLAHEYGKSICTNLSTQR
jgi:hypothetical protein